MTDDAEAPLLRRCYCIHCRIGFYPVASVQLTRGDTVRTLPRHPARACAAFRSLPFCSSGCLRYSFCRLLAAIFLLRVPPAGSSRNHALQIIVNRSSLVQLRM